MSNILPVSNFLHTCTTLTVGIACMGVWADILSFCRAAIVGADQVYHITSLAGNI